jgi:uroporphyrinogen decarboxylase
MMQYKILKYIYKFSVSQVLPPIQNGRTRHVPFAKHFISFSAVLNKTIKSDSYKIIDMPHPTEEALIQQSKFMQTLAGQPSRTAPIWLMRQAGRYLPEYRALRARAPTFLDFCHNPKLAAEATVQPINRFNFDAAILFSDILVIPDALGQNVTFETGEGPRLDPIDSPEKLLSLTQQLDLNRLSAVFETIDLARSKLPNSVPLIGFCGAPWTVATYMIAGRGTPDQAPARLFAYRHHQEFSALIDILIDSSIEYLKKQIEVGVNAVQIFDSWSGVLPDSEFEAWCLRPLMRIVRALKAEYPATPIIAFPRAAGTHLSAVADISEIDAIGLDTATNLSWAAKSIQTNMAIQGNLDPLALLAGGDRLDASIDRILDAFRGRPHIFNLGHGILPQTPIENVERLIARVRR